MSESSKNPLTFDIEKRDDLVIAAIYADNFTKFLSSKHFFISLIVLFSSFAFAECLGVICSLTANPGFQVSDFIFVLPSLLAAVLCILWLYYFYGIPTGIFKNLYFTGNHGIPYHTLNITMRHSGIRSNSVEKPENLLLKDIEETLYIPKELSVMQFLLKIITNRTHKAPEGYQVYFRYLAVFLIAWLYTFIMASFGFTSYNFCVGSVYAPWNFFVFGLLTATTSTLVFIYRNLEYLLQYEAVTNEDRYLELLVLFNTVSSLTSTCSLVTCLTLMILLLMDLIRVILYPQSVSLVVNLFRMLLEFLLIRGILNGISRVNRLGSLLTVQQYLFAPSTQIPLGSTRLEVAYRLLNGYAVNWQDVLRIIMSLLATLIVAVFRAWLTGNP